MVSKFSIFSIVLFLFSAGQTVCGQGKMSNQDGAEPNGDTFGQIGYTSLIILLFFLFTIFGILTAFLIKHKPRRKTAVGRSAKLDVENQLSSENQLEDSNEVATFELIESNQEAQQPAIRFSDPKSPFESYESAPIKSVKEKLMEDYLQQPSSDDFSYASPDSLKTEDLTQQPSDSADSNKLLDDDSSVNTQSPQFQEIPKELIIANVEPVQKEEDTQTEQTEPFVNTEDAKDKELLSDRLPIEEKMKEFDRMENELKPRDERPIDKKIDDLLDTKFEENFNGLPVEDGKAKKDEIPEYATFPDGSELGKSEGKSIESEKSTKSYHSYGFPHEDHPPAQSGSKPKDETNPTVRWRKLYDNQKLDKTSDYNEPMKSMPAPSAQTSEENKSQGSESLEEEQEREKSPVKQSQMVDKDKDEFNKDNESLREIKDVELVPKNESKLDLKEEKKSKVSSPRHDYKLIVSPPLDEDNPNAKNEESKESSPTANNDEAKEEAKEEANEEAASPSSPNTASTSASTTASDVFSSPEDTNPDTLIRESLLNESENSSLQSESWASSAPASERNQQVREKPHDKATDAQQRAADKNNETGSLKTLNSVNASLTDYSIPKRPGRLHADNVQASPKANAKDQSKRAQNTSNLSPLATQPQSGPPTSTQSGRQGGRTPKSVLDVLEKRKRML